MRNLLHTTRMCCKRLIIKWLYECNVGPDTTRILHHSTRVERLHVYAIVAARLFPSPKGENRSKMSVVWCSVSVVWRLTLHGYKILIINEIQRFCVVCNSFRYFCVCYDTQISRVSLRREVQAIAKWSSAHFAKCLGVAVNCCSKDRKLPQLGQFRAFRRHKAGWSSVACLSTPICVSRKAPTRFFRTCGG